MTSRERAIHRQIDMIHKNYFFGDKNFIDLMLYSLSQLHCCTPDIALNKNRDNKGDTNDN